MINDDLRALWNEYEQITRTVTPGSDEEDAMSLQEGHLASKPTSSRAIEVKKVYLPEIIKTLAKKSQTSKNTRNKVITLSNKGSENPKTPLKRKQPNERKADMQTELDKLVSKIRGHTQDQDHKNQHKLRNEGSVSKIDRLISLNKMNLTQQNSEMILIQNQASPTKKKCCLSKLKNLQTLDLIDEVNTDLSRHYNNRSRMVPLKTSRTEKPGELKPKKIFPPNVSKAEEIWDDADMRLYQIMN